MLAGTIPDLASEIIKDWGPAGSIVVALAVAIVYLYSKVGKIQDARVKDAKESAEKMVALAQEMTHVIRDSTVANQQMTSAVQHLRDMFLLVKGG